MDINEKKGLLTGAISLLADVCDAAGSPTGKQTPEELVARIRRMREALEGIQMIPSNQPQHVYEVMVKAITRTALQ